MTKYQFNPNIEQWKEIPNFPGYEISDHGHVRSWKHKAGIREIPHTLKPSYNGKYLIVNLRKNNTGYGKLVHRLVLSAFIGPCPIGMEACHNDGNMVNNLSINLRWDTRINNHADKKIHGTQIYGSQIPTSKLTETDVLDIRKLYALGNTTMVALAYKYNVCGSTISGIIKRRRWKHV